MFQEVSGDILLSTANAIAHGVAPNDHFDQGLALALRNNWPAMVKDFRHWCRTSGAKPGDVFVWPAPTGQRFIALLTQEPAKQEGGHPGRARIENVRHALHALRNIVEQEKITGLALPRLATGVGGLDWKEVWPVMSEVLAPLPIPVAVYTNYRAGMKANEGQAPAGKPARAEGRSA